MRAALAAVVETLLRGTSPGDAVELDAVGDAIGALAVSQDEIDAVLSAIEARGRRVVSPPGGQGEAQLKRVLDAARVLRTELGRPPRADEIAPRAGLSNAEVQRALALARVIQR